MPWYDLWPTLRNGYLSTLLYALMCCLVLTPMSVCAKKPFAALACWLYFLAFTGFARGASAVASKERRPKVFLIALFAGIIGNLICTAYAEARNLDDLPLAQAFLPLLSLDSGGKMREPLLILLPAAFGMLGCLYAHRLEREELGKA